jgi:flavin reductase (DIM6/NTAB) family NADH-FMN oxidoreductase RutF
MAYDSEKLRQTMRMWVTGVTVVGAKDGGRLYGMTVSSFTSVTLEPPLVLVCLQKRLETAQAVFNSRAFSVSMLGQGQEGLSSRFAGITPLAEGEDRFDGVALHFAEGGSPILKDSLAWLDCQVEAIHDGGTHQIVIGRVLEASGHEPGHDSDPLLYYNRAYRRFAD